VPADVFAPARETLGVSRVRGFEQLRDTLLTEWVALSTRIPLHALLKLVLETDRHALYAMVAESKVDRTEDVDRWSAFQKWLHEGVRLPETSSPVEPTEDPDDAAAA
jgi:hypothetical protein